MPEPIIDWSDHATYFYGREYEGLFRRLAVKLRILRRRPVRTMNCFAENKRLYRAIFGKGLQAYAVFVPVNKELLETPIDTYLVEQMVRAEAKRRYREAQEIPAPA